MQLIGRCMVSNVAWLTVGRMIRATMGALVVALLCSLSELVHLIHGVVEFVRSQIEDVT